MNDNTSYDYEQDKYYAQNRLRFLQEIKTLLSCADGGHRWNHTLLRQAEINLGLREGEYFLLFSNDLFDIVRHFEEWRDNMMLEYLSKLEEPKKIREKIAEAVIYRLMGQYKSRNWQQICIKTASYLACPDHVFYSQSIGWKTCDRIWRWAGDKSVDFNYYSKRGILFSVYTASILFFMADRSENYLDTQNFIKTSLANIVNIAKFKPVFSLSKLQNIPIVRLFT